ncbi:MAG: HAD family hydrolase, partial [Deltaproteobacteria bacterium]
MTRCDDAPHPRPLKDADLSSVVGLCFDVDDTLTTAGRIGLEAWRALWKAHEAGLALVAVTGRPAGWCDLMCRQWPIDGVVGENGAFYFAWDPVRRRVLRRWAQDAATRARGRARLERIREEVLRSVPGARVASDQAYRAADLAIDWAEDTGPLSEAAVQRIVEIFRRHGATARVSS